MAQAKLLLSQAWLDKLVDCIELTSITFADLVRTLEQCLNVTFPMIKWRVTYLSMIKGDSYRAGEGLASLYRRCLQQQRVGGMGTRADFKLTWGSLHHTMVVASMPSAAQQELYR